MCVIAKAHFKSYEPVCDFVHKINHFVLYTGKITLDKNGVYNLDINIRKHEKKIFKINFL